MGTSIIVLRDFTITVDLVTASTKAMNTETGSPVADVRIEHGTATPVHRIAKPVSLVSTISSSIGFADGTAALPNGAISISVVSEIGTGLFCCGMGWNTTSELCLSESASGSFYPFTVDIGVVILNRSTGATTANLTATKNTAGNSSVVTAQPDRHESTTNAIPAAIGIGVAVSVGVLLVSTAVVFLWRLRKLRAHQAFQQLDTKDSNPSTPRPPTPHVLPAPCNKSTSLKHTGHIELEDSPRHFQGLGIPELDAYR
jgi:hypothetical protein